MMPSRNELYPTQDEYMSIILPPSNSVPALSPSLFYKFECTARIFSRIFNFHPSSLPPIPWLACAHSEGFFFIPHFAVCERREKCHILWLCWYRIGKKNVFAKNRHHLKRRWKNWLRIYEHLILYRVSSGELFLFQNVQYFVGGNEGKNVN